MEVENAFKMNLFNFAPKINSMKHEILSVETGVVRLEDILENIYRNFNSLKSLTMFSKGDKEASKRKIKEVFDTIGEEFDTLKKDILVVISVNVGNIKQEICSLSNSMPIKEEPTDCEQQFQKDESKPDINRKTSNIFVEKANRNSEPEVDPETSMNFLETAGINADINSIDNNRNDSNIRRLSTSENENSLVGSITIPGSQKTFNKSTSTQCPECGKLVCKSSLKRHILTHTGKKPFTCSHCGKSYSVKYRLNNHLKVCTASGGLKKLYSCSLCDATFTSTTGLGNHKRTHKIDVKQETQPTKKLVSETVTRSHENLSQSVKLNDDTDSWIDSGDEMNTTDSSYNSSNINSPDLFNLMELKCHVETTTEKGSSEITTMKDVCEITAMEDLCTENTSMDDFNENTTINSIITEGLEENTATDDFGLNAAAESTPHTGRKKPKRVQCSECSKYFCKSSSLKRHILTHTGEKPCKCSRCGKGFSVSYRLNNHLKICTATGGVRLYKCRLCNATFNNIRSLGNHKRIHGEEMKKEGFPIEPTEPPEKFTCETCGKVVLSLHNLAQHIKAFHSQSSWVCSVCGQVFTQRRYLQKHSKKHLGVTPYICDQCGKAFNDKSRLNSHLKIHEQQDIYTCTICDKSYANESNYKVHMTVHNDEQTHTCDVCNASFSHISKLKAHKNSHVLKYTCELCGKLFSKNYNLVRHRRWHLGERSYKCTICSKAFVEQGGLTAHMRIHSGERRHACQHCDKCFTESNALKRHVRIHTGEKPYVCHVCDKRFNQSSSLKSHKKMHHPPLPPAINAVADEEF